MTKTAVLHIITRLDLGGAQKSCLALIHELQKNYPEFEVYLISGTTGELVPQAQKLAHVWLLDSLVWEIHPRLLLLEIRNFYRIFKIMRSLKLKHAGKIMVHTHTIKAGTIGRWCAFLAGIKIRVHTIHGFGFNIYQNKLVWLIFYLIELINSLITSHFICVSSQDKHAGSEILPFFSTKSTIIRAATLYPNHQSKNPLNLAQHRPFCTIGTIASLKTGKNLFELLKAFQWASRHQPKLQLEIIGDGPLRQALEMYLKQHNLLTKVKILGWQANPCAYSCHWQAFAFTSLWEGLPCAVIEMLDAQIPVISYQVGGISDLIPANQLFYSGKWQDLAQAMLNLASHSHNGLEPKPPTQPNQAFYIPKMALDHVFIYKQLLN